MALTRRRLLLDSARLSAGMYAGALFGAIPGARTQPARGAQAAARLTPPGLPSPPFRDSSYWAFADWLAPYFDPLWDPDQRFYRFGNGSSNRIYQNSALLTTHAIAALAGHNGPSRHDGRARLLARRLCESPPWSERTAPRSPDPQFHSPGWVAGMETIDSPMDKSIDPKVAEALAYAWRARDTLQLPGETRDLIRDRISRSARGSFFRYPSIRLNQINWHSELYSVLATVTGDTELLVNDYRLQVERFVAGIKRPLSEGGSPNLGPGYRFHYLPHRPPDHPFNLDSAEYANMTCHFLIHYEQALRAGMTPLPREQLRLLRAWVERIVCGYWTHAGYLNWDTGLSFKRWHAGRTWALAQLGLLAIASSPRFQTRPELGRWAKYMLDAGLELYERLSREAQDGLGIAPAVLYGIDVHPLGLSVRELFAARMQANAARAVALGLGKMEGEKPPPLYAFDPDIGRLAVTTPTYSTAVLPVNQGATVYGGIELARLHDRDQRVVSNVAGKPPASFGVRIRDTSGKPVLLSQRARSQPRTETLPLELVRSPRGAVKRTVPYPRRPHAGSFEGLVARGRAESLETSVESTHRFRSRWVETRWRVVRRRPGRRYTVEVLFPSWGQSARIEAVLTGGRRITLAAPAERRRRVSLANVVYFYLAGKDTGYVVVPIRPRARGMARIVTTVPQSGAPDPGPTLALELAHRAAFKRLDLAVGMAPARDPRRAARVAKRIRRSRRRRARKRRRR